MQKLVSLYKEGKKLISYPVYFLNSFYRRWRSEKKTLMSLGVEKDVKYNDYLRVQVGKTVLKINKDASFRYEIIIKEILNKPTVNKEGVLCVGCRNSFELDAFEKAGFSGVKGVDIQSNDPRIMVMDMGQMTLESNSFNVLYSGDSLEHAYDVNQALSEFCRVVKAGGYIAIVVPVNYSIDDIDRWDLKNVENLRIMIEKNVNSAIVIWEEVTVDCIKAIFRIVK